MTPIESIARLCALVPPPRYPLTRFHGSRRARLRPRIVPNAAPRAFRTRVPYRRPRAESPTSQPVTRGSVQSLATRAPRSSRQDCPFQPRRSHAANRVVVSNPELEVASHAILGRPVPPTAAVLGAMLEHLPARPCDGLEPQDASVFSSPGENDCEALAPSTADVDCPYKALGAIFGPALIPELAVLPPVYLSNKPPQVSLNCR